MISPEQDRIEGWCRAAFGTKLDFGADVFTDLSPGACAVHVYCNGKRRSLLVDLANEAGEPRVLSDIPASEDERFIATIRSAARHAKLI